MLFQILDGILSSDYADDIIADAYAIQRYAEACDCDISDEDAAKIANVGQRWLCEQRDGNGEWSRLRDEAQRALA
jgi:hypothetical protein